MKLINIVHMKAKIGVGILGGTGYGAGELLRLLAAHSQVKVLSVISSSGAGHSVATTHRELEGFYQGLQFESELDLKRFSNYESRIIFSSLPHGTSAREITKVLAQAESEKVQIKIIDLSGDFRLHNSTERQRHYPEAVAEDSLRTQFVYGLTESNRKTISQARLVANPGCLASACALAVLPLVDAKFRGKIIFDAKTGSSGGGRGLSDTMHHPFRHSNVNAYKMLEHRHEPEIREALGDFQGQRIETTFVPHLLPISRGIFASAYLDLEHAVSTDELRARYRKFYESSAFIRVRETSPDLNAVVGSNFCDISVASRGTQVVAMAALDNLVKGMAGQAIQNMNLISGLPETEGLWTPALSLV